MVIHVSTAHRWEMRSFYSQPLPLAAIYVLGERQHLLAAPSIEAIIPQIGLMQLITHRYPQSLQLERDMRSLTEQWLKTLSFFVLVKKFSKLINVEFPEG
ncbi:hypothetical protein [Nostoc sp. UHCC 0252]|uniref:hypothetical protein n=1 Tax=Nostoc sp. UHCC 0252 TaxID=3110241 RepID=UPI002B1E9549|nr:hypothetical protein [Nostoc sp. UHCC 0252]MEA5600204.1 hypothetical protein [Nostoc sp. UHCC 0252]